MSKSKETGQEAARVSRLVLQKLADVQAVGKRVLFLAPAWSEEAFKFKSTVPAEPPYCFNPVPDYLLWVEVRLSDPAAAKHVDEAITHLAKQACVQVGPMAVQDHYDFAYRRHNGEVLKVQVSPLDHSATISVHTNWPPRTDRQVIYQNRLELACGVQHVGFGYRITEAGLNSLADRAEREAEHPEKVDSRPATTFTASQVAARFGVDIDTVYGWLRTGLLPSVNVAAKAGSRKPRYMIRQQDLDQFEQTRATKPPPARQSRKRKNPGVEKFF
jgi:hypothetical protein